MVNIKPGQENAPGLRNIVDIKSGQGNVPRPGNIVNIKSGQRNVPCTSIITALILSVLVLMSAGCSDWDEELYEEDGYGYCDPYEEGDQYGYCDPYEEGDQYGYCDPYEEGDQYDFWDQYEESDPYGYYDGENDEGSYYDTDADGGFTLGSSGALEGRIAVVTILLDDRNNSWDLEDEKDQEIYGYIHNDLKVACDWITRSCAGYGREVEFVWDWTEHEELICDLSTDISVEGNLEYYYDDLARLIRQNVDADDIKSKNDANGIIYLACVDTPYSNQNTSSTFMSERSNPAEEEFCIMMMRTDGDIEPPSAFAHEMLHTFGAADLYMSGMYGITDELVRYFENSGSNDIMFRCEDKRTGEYYYDRITNEITEITAYYSGLTDESETVREWGLERSDYQ